MSDRSSAAFAAKLYGYTSPVLGFPCVLDDHEKLTPWLAWQEAPWLDGPQFLADGALG